MTSGTPARPPSDLLPAVPAWFAHRAGDERRLGAFLPERGSCVDLGPRDELAMLAGGGLDRDALLALASSGRHLPLPGLRFDVPVARPGKILCLGKNFAAHAREFGAEVPDEPIFFTKLPDTFVPHEADVVLPHWVTTRIDHEVELCVVLGFPDPSRRGRRYVRAADAMELVAGYTLLNDVTARTMQGDDRGKQQPWLRCKSFDTFCPIGPFVVPRGALPEPLDLALDCWVGDAHRQSSRTAFMVVDVPHAIEYLSRHTTLRCGDLIAMGTPEGVGPIQHGDEMVCTLEGVGLLRNRVVREATPRT
ncbi:MAG: fumarylacetoacetate hydrolase family protein [Planctomycetes bacterium]|nr:fumarylacetoacetate hydrolase family protein [Planctomycetota bacterium]